MIPKFCRYAHRFTITKAVSSAIALLLFCSAPACGSDDAEDTDGNAGGRGGSPASAGEAGVAAGEGGSSAGAGGVSAAAGAAGTAAYEPGVTPDDFVDEIDHPYFPAGPPGTKWVYESETEDGLEQTYVEALPDKRTVWGVEATVIRDTVYVDGELAEDTWDWFAQDSDGNVWYLGEDTAEYEGGEIVSQAGAWEAGVDGALPGIVMPAELEPGDPYYQEYYEGKAEDQGQIVSIGESVEVPAGSWDDCIKTHDTTTLDPEVSEFKYYCEAIGVALEEEEDVRVELVSFDNEQYAPDITGDDLDTNVDNTWFPLPIGAHWTYEATTEDGTERIEVEVLEETKDVWGVTASVVRDTVYLDDEVIEDTWDWYGQDSDGNVWYLGEETYEYEDGEMVCDCGSWESGVDGALPGIIMLGTPEVGASYYQEYFIGEAEDRGDVVETDVSVEVPAGSFEGCITTRDYSAINPASALKTYCEGVGTVLEVEGDERVELIEYSGL